MEPNANYIMVGDEVCIHSSWTWPKGQITPGYSRITSFSVKFANKGTYECVCLPHPKMAGQVVVR